LTFQPFHPVEGHSGAVLQQCDHRHGGGVVFIGTDVCGLFRREYLAAGITALCRLWDYAASGIRRQRRASFDATTGGIGAFGSGDPERVINHFFTHPRVLARLRQGVLAEFLDDYAKSLHDQGYSRESIRIQLRLIDAFGRWLKRKRIAFQEIDRGILDGFLRHHRHHSVQNGDGSTLQRFLAVAILRQGSGVNQSPNQPVESVPVIDEYREYLSHERGFAESTIRYYALFAARFLSEERIGSLRQLTHVRAVDVSGFVQRHARRQSPGSARLMVNCTTVLLSLPAL
jgi:hypothetical protein